VKVINESDIVIDNELLPQILRRVFSVCKADPNFYIKDKMENIDNTIYKLEKKLEKNDLLLKSSEEISSGLKTRINNLEQKNIDIKNELLEELGSEI
jgi:uncharacterized protein (DUF2344 family)